MADGIKLFVGSLPPDITDDEVRSVFDTYGTVTDCHVMHGKSASGQSCGFIVFDRKDSAESAVEALNGVYKFREDSAEPIQVSFARSSGGKGGNKGGGKGKDKGWGAVDYGYGGGYKGGKGDYWGGGGDAWGGGGGCKGTGGYKGDGKGYGYGGDNGYGGGYGGGKGKSGGYQQQPSMKGGGGGGFGNVNPPPPPFGSQPGKLFVGNLPPDITPDVLNMVFKTYGNVKDMHIMAGKAKSGQSCAFVEYSTPQEAETAVLTLHEKYEIRPGDGMIVVKYASSTAKRPSPY
eukprot:TRINITY_DN8591_c0_g7_i1.p1 TRINITY_DN8591_c0_g7~~TRINITY_DN8591_c0_g7_i1.p1  ORF type:complete len:289 (-),score=67.56 TRINITY_DN8591_c0_g7_i1:91-957(-)